MKLQVLDSLNAEKLFGHNSIIVLQRPEVIFPKNESIRMSLHGE